jgi:hypothetical protein
MKPFRVSIAATLTIIAICALGFMGLREGKPIWASLMFCLTLACLLAATLKGTIGTVNTRPGPVGFAVFGWVYLVTVFGPWGKLEIPQMPQSWGVERALERLHPQPEYVEYEEAELGLTWRTAPMTYTVIRQINGNVVSQQLKPGSVAWTGDGNCFRQTAHAMGALAFGIVGALAARFVARRSTSGSA